MLDQLAPELLDRILLLTLHGPKETWERRRDQTWLASICLTCRALSTRAQLLLYGDILIQSISGKDALERTLRDRPDLAKRVRGLCLKHDYYGKGPSIDLASGFNLFPLLPELRVVTLLSFEKEPLDLVPLAAIPHLQTLILDSVVLERVSGALAFPSLISLSLSTIMVAPNVSPHPAQNSLAPSLLTPTILPSLRALSLDFFPPANTATLGPLEVLQLHAYARWDGSDRLLRDISQLNVVSFALDADDLESELAALPPCHWRVLVPREDSRFDWSLTPGLKDLAAFLRDAASPPLSIHLTRDLARLDWGDDLEEYQEALQRCVDAAEERKIPVRWHDEDPEGEGTHVVSESCWQLLRELKAKGSQQ
ncbi:hypothetical protein JCM10207_006350 [Rhodosporidiobolus poonsookiae]